MTENELEEKGACALGNVKEANTPAFVFWKFRVSACSKEGSELRGEDILAGLVGIAKEYAFQLEEGEGGYKHWQGHLRLVKRARKFHLMNLLVKNGIPAPNYLEKTSSNAMGSWFYELKLDSRVPGSPQFTDKDQDHFVPDHLRGYIEKCADGTWDMHRLYDYQKEIFSCSFRPVSESTRYVHVIYDPVGCRGKSVIAGLCALYGRGVMLPPMNGGRDGGNKELMQTLLQICKSKGMRSPNPILIDMPRGNQEEPWGVYSAIEQIKNGWLYDCRYTWTEYWINRPEVYVFTNALPSATLLSRDRWRCYGIDDNFRFVRFDLNAVGVLKSQDSSLSDEAAVLALLYGKTEKLLGKKQSSTEEKEQELEKGEQPSTKEAGKVGRPRKAKGEQSNLKARAQVDTLT